MAPAYEHELFMLIPGLLSSIPAGLFNIAVYVLSALAIYTISRRRGLRKPWLAWVPVLNVWLLGSLSDQYQYVVRREDRSKRKWLLGLGILMIVFWFAAMILAIVMVGSAIIGSGYPGDILAEIFGPAMALLGLLLPLGGVMIAYHVIRYMALYDVFKSLDPDNCVLFLVLSVLIRPTEPFFLFFSRNKDGGMPPRRQEPVYDQPPVQEPWEQKDYL